MRGQAETTSVSSDLHGVVVCHGVATAVGGRGTIVRSTDVWRRLSSPTEENLYAITAGAEGLVAVGGDLHIGGSSLLVHERAEGWVAELSGMQHILLTATCGRAGLLVGGSPSASLARSCTTTGRAGLKSLAAPTRRCSQSTEMRGRWSRSVPPAWPCASRVEGCGGPDPRM